MCVGLSLGFLSRSRILDDVTELLHLPSSRLLVKRDNEMTLMPKSLLLAANCICKSVQSLRNVTWQYISVLNVHALWFNNSIYQEILPLIYSHCAQISTFEWINDNIMYVTIWLNWLWYTCKMKHMLTFKGLAHLCIGKKLCFRYIKWRKWD